MPVSGDQAKYFRDEQRRIEDKFDREIAAMKEKYHELYSDTRLLMYKLALLSSGIVLVFGAAINYWIKKLP